MVTGKHKHPRSKLIYHISVQHWTDRSESIQGCMVQHFHGRVLWLVSLNQCTHVQLKFNAGLFVSFLETFPQISNQYKSKIINNKKLINIFAV